MKMTLALRTARRWLGWIRYTDRVRYWRTQARQNADVEQTMRRLRNIALGQVLEGVAELRIANDNAAQLGEALDAAHAARRDAERRNRTLQADLDQANELAAGRHILIDRLGNELAASARLAEMTPARRAAAMTAVDPTNEFG